MEPLFLYGRMDHLLKVAIDALGSCGFVNCLYQFAHFCLLRLSHNRFSTFYSGDNITNLTCMTLMFAPISQWHFAEAYLFRIILGNHFIVSDERGAKGTPIRLVGLDCNSRFSHDAEVSCNTSQHAIIKLQNCLIYPLLDLHEPYYP